MPEFDAQLMAEAMQHGSRAASLASADVMCGLLPDARPFRGWMVGPISLGHVLALSKVGNALAGVLVGAEAPVLSMGEQLRADQEAFYVLTRGADVSLAAIRRGSFNADVEGFISELPLAHAFSGFADVMALAVGDSMRAYLPMEADGGGKGGKLRSLG